MKELLSNFRTKSQLTELLAEALLNEFEDSDKDLVVSYENLVKSNNAELLPDDMKIHTHKEADRSARTGCCEGVKGESCRRWVSGHTDVLILLMDVAANGIYM